MSDESTVHDVQRARWVELGRSLLLGRARIVMVAAGITTAFLVLGSEFVDEGEVVRLAITDDAGRTHETDLWIVDLEDGSYLRAAEPDAHWLVWLRANPRIKLERAGSEHAFLAVPDEHGETRSRVGTAMAEKYGFADRLWSVLADRSSAIAIRLYPMKDDAEEPSRKRRDHD